MSAAAGQLLRSAPVVGALRSLLPAAIALFVLFAVLPRTGAYRTVTVLSASMKPTFAPGDLLLLRPEPMSAIRPGQLVTFAIPGGDRHVETHRIVQVLRGGDNPIIRTKGDANNVRDPWTAELHGSTAWHVVRVIPFGGRPILWLRTPAVHRALVFGMPLLALLIGLVGIWTPKRQPAPVTTLATGQRKKDDAAVAA